MSICARRRAPGETRFCSYICIRVYVLMYVDWDCISICMYTCIYIDVYLLTWDALSTRLTWCQTRWWCQLVKVRMGDMIWLTQTHTNTRVCVCVRARACVRDAVNGGKPPIVWWHEINVIYADKTRYMYRCGQRQRIANSNSPLSKKSWSPATPHRSPRPRFLSLCLSLSPPPPPPTHPPSFFPRWCVYIRKDK